MELVLKINGEDKTFVQTFISARMLRRTIEIGKSTDPTDIDEKKLDMLVDYLVELFCKQFTRDQVYDGLESKKLLPTIIECMQEVTGKTDKALEPLTDPNA